MGTLRLLLALSVLNMHAPFGDLFLFVNGGVAVLLFFIVSGFYMSLVINDRYTGAGGTRRFYLNRAVRIYPVYFAALALAALWMFAVRGESLFPPGLDTAHRWLLAVVNVTLLGMDVTFFMGRAGFEPALAGGYVINVAWTVGVELTFYLFAPFLVRFGWKGTAALL
ncbi:MAG: acyltransferase family protein, partial [Nitrospinae bacterium]|nr:acyltransferase family protein [Nitrospinota bacterium]